MAKVANGSPNFTKRVINLCTCVGVGTIGHYSFLISIIYCSSERLSLMFLISYWIVGSDKVVSTCCCFFYLTSGWYEVLIGSIGFMACLTILIWGYEAGTWVGFFFNSWGIILFSFFNTFGLFLVCNWVVLLDLCKLVELSSIYILELINSSWVWIVGVDLIWLTFFWGMPSSLSSKKIIPWCSLILQRTLKATSLTSEVLSFVKEIRVPNKVFRILVDLCSFLEPRSFRSFKVLSFICGDLSFSPSVIYCCRSSNVIEFVMTFKVANVSSTIMALLSFSLR